MSYINKHLNDTLCNNINKSVMFLLSLCYHYIILILLDLAVLAAFIHPASHFADWSASGQNQKPAGGSRPPEEDTAGRVRLRWQEVSPVGGSPSKTCTPQLLFLFFPVLSVSLRLYSYFSGGDRHKMERLKNRKDQLHPFKWVSPLFYSLGTATSLLFPSDKIPPPEWLSEGKHVMETDSLCVCFLLWA